MPLSRREFLKLTGIGAGAFAIEANPLLKYLLLSPEQQTPEILGPATIEARFSVVEEYTSPVPVHVEGAGTNVRVNPDNASDGQGTLQELQLIDTNNNVSAIGITLNGVRDLQPGQVWVQTRSGWINANASGASRDDLVRLLAGVPENLNTQLDASSLVSTQVQRFVPNQGGPRQFQPAVNTDTAGLLNAVINTRREHFADGLNNLRQTEQIFEFVSLQEETYLPSIGFAAVVDNTDTGTQSVVWQSDVEQNEENNRIEINYEIITIPQGYTPGWVDHNDGVSKGLVVTVTGSDGIYAIYDPNTQSWVQLEAVEVPVAPVVEMSVPIERPADLFHQRLTHRQIQEISGGRSPVILSGREYILNRSTDYYKTGTPYNPINWDQIPPDEIIFGRFENPFPQRNRPVPAGPVVRGLVNDVFQAEIYTINSYRRWVTFVDVLVPIDPYNSQGPVWLSLRLIKDTQGPNYVTEGSPIREGFVPGDNPQNGELVLTTARPTEVFNYLSSLKGQPVYVFDNNSEGNTVTEFPESFRLLHDLLSADPDLIATATAQIQDNPNLELISWAHGISPIN